MLVSVRLGQIRLGSFIFLTANCPTAKNPRGPLKLLSTIVHSPGGYADAGKDGGGAIGRGAERPPLLWGRG